jgi:hypothetical protein
VEPATPHLILETIVAAVFLGILAQVLAERFRLPAIMPLLLLGMAAGPQGLGLLDPRSSSTSGWRSSCSRAGCRSTRATCARSARRCATC